jgi:CubicO group peptidase (beta-lactamase class C family)
MAVFLAGTAVMLSCMRGAPWRSAPSADALPEESRVYDARYAHAADSAMQQLRDARARLGAPALSAAISVEGQLVWAGVVGWADVAARRAATVETEFRIGSTSKAVTATALARLVEARRIALDTPIVRYLPTLPNAAWGALTARQLASHTAGIPDYAKNRDLIGLWRSWRETTRYPSATAALEVFDGSKLVAPPGTRFLYSSFDVNLVGAVIESITGRRYPDAMDSLVFAPRGVTGIHAQHTADSSRHAVFYESKDGRWRPWRAVDHSYKWPSGGLVATPSAVARIGSAWFDSTFISAGTRAEFWTPQRLTNGQVNEQSYALGWRAQQSTALWGDSRPTPVVHHGGVSKGAFSWLALYPTHQVAVALAMNAGAPTFPAFMRKEPPLVRLFLGATRY